MEFTYNVAVILPFKICGFSLAPSTLDILSSPGNNYGNGLSKTMKKRKFPDNVEDLTITSARSSHTSTTYAGEAWYRRHLNERYRLKYIGPLPRNTVKKMSRYGVDFLDGGGLDSDNNDPFQVSLERSALSVGLSLIESELESQDYLRDILVYHHKILGSFHQPLLEPRSRDNIQSLNPPVCCDHNQQY